MSCRVPAAAVVLTDLADLLNVRTREAVNQSRFADPRRTEQGDCLTDGKVLIERVNACAGKCAYRVHRYAAAYGPDPRHQFVHVGTEVDLTQHDDGVRSALPGGDQVTLQPPGVEFLIRRRYQEYGIHVGCDDLHL